MKENTKALLFCLPLFGIALATGCNIGQPLYHGTESIASKLETNRSKWQENKPQNYQFKFSKSCFCDEKSIDDMVITVKNKTIIKAVEASTKRTVDLSQAHEALSIEDLFNKISQEVERHAHQVDVKFNNDLGYPEQVWVDVERQIPNDEYAISIYGLIALENAPLN